MNRTGSLWVALLVGVIAAFIGAACGGSGSSTPTNPQGTTVTSVTVSGPTSLTAGQTSQFTATATMSNGSTQSCSSSAVWQSTNTSVATVTSSGMVTAISAGVSDIRATCDGTAGAAHVTVVAPGAALSGSGRTLPTTPPVGSTLNLIIVNVTKAENPPSTGIKVVANLTAIGASAALALDDGGITGPSGCDDISNDGTYIACFNVGTGIAPGTYVLPVVISDAQGRTANTSITVTIPGTGSFHGTLNVGGIPTAGVALQINGYPNTGTIRNYTTGAGGAFSDPAVPAGPYTVYRGSTAVGTFTVTAGSDTVFTVGT